MVFDTIYAEGGVTRASRRLNLSQPAVSHALGRLREMFGDALFTRHGYVMTPTPLARRLIEPIRQSLQGLEVTLSKVDRFNAASATKRFVIGMRDAQESVVLAALMRRITREAPRVDINVVRTERRDIERELSGGTLDVALDVLLPLPEDIRRQPSASSGSPWWRRTPGGAQEADARRLRAEHIACHPPPGLRRRTSSSVVTTCAGGSGCAARTILPPARWWPKRI